MRRLLVLLLVVACKPSPTPPPPVPVFARPIDGGVALVTDAQPSITPTEQAPAIPYRTDKSDYDVDPKVAGTGKTFMVASEDEYATKVGRDMLAAGGNAVDAAVATAFALAVTRPTAGNLGGGGFAVVRTGKGKATALDFRETAPAKATPTMYESDPKSSLVGFKASGVPGSVAGLHELHRKLGKKKWADVVAPAIALAKDGYQVGPYLHDAIARRNKLAPLTGEFAARFAPDGQPLAVGAVVKNPELAAVLERIAAKGPDGFYKGETAKAIVDAMAAGGGIITAKDLTSYKAVWRQPIEFAYRGKHVMTMPVPSSGGIVLAMTANILSSKALDKDLGTLGWHSADHVRLVVEAWRRAFAARNELLGDPAYVKKMPLQKLLSQPEADRLAKTIGERATPSSDVPALLEGTNTTNLSVVDSKGMAVALTTTLNTSFGSGVMISGILMNNEMDDFATRPGQPNVFGLVQGVANKVEPGKRMLSSMSPTIIEDDKGELYMVVGAQGGPRIITAVWQAMSNVIDFGMPVDAAVAAPRFHHQHLPDDVVFEDEAVTKAVDDALHALGYKTVWSMRERIGAAANAIVKTKDGWAGTADPRGRGAAMGD